MSGTSLDPGPRYHEAVGARERDAKGRLLGRPEPRIFTPPLRELSPDTSLGFACIEFAETVCKLDLFPWQRVLLIRALELAPNLTVPTLGTRDPLDPMFRFRKIVVLVARQSGKSTLSQVLSLFFLYELGTDLILGTAQDLDTAEEVWDGALDIIEETPELAELAAKPILVNGKKTIRLHTGERYKVKAANRRAGRGLSGDLILLDELREHQSWDAWGAITKTTMARPAAMIWALSNAGDATSVVLRYLRKQAHAALDDPDGINAEDDPAGALLPTSDDLDEMADLALDGPDLDIEDFEEDGSSLGLFEWSAPPGCPVTDVDGILQANPSVGHCISLRTIVGDAKADPEWVFRTECLCQWSDGTLEGPFPPGSWEKSADESPERVGDVALCVDVSWDRGTSHVGLAFMGTDGLPHVEVVASRAGTDWLAGWLTAGDRSDAVRSAPVAVQAKGAPASSLIEGLREADVNVVEWGGGDIPNATGNFYDRVRSAVDAEAESPGLRHRNQPLLNVAAATAVPKLTEGGAFMWDRKKSPTDAAPLIAVTGALWCLTRPTEKPTRSAYEDDDLMVV
jgi:hypothetical protein